MINSIMYYLLLARYCITRPIRDVCSELSLIFTNTGVCDNASDALFREPTTSISAKRSLGMMCLCIYICR